MTPKCCTNYKWYARAAFLWRQVPAVLAVLRAARSLGLLDDLDDIVVTGDGPTAVPADTASSGNVDRSNNLDGAALQQNGPGSLRVPFSLLQAALASRDEAVRVDALQLVLCSPRSSALPGNTDSALSTLQDIAISLWHMNAANGVDAGAGEVELRLARLAMGLAFRTQSRSLRNKWRGAHPDRSSCCCHLDLWALSCYGCCAASALMPPFRICAECRAAEGSCCMCHQVAPASS